MNFKVIDTLIGVLNFVTSSKASKQDTAQITTNLRTLAICIWALLSIRSSVRSFHQSIPSKSSKQFKQRNSMVTEKKASVALCIFLLLLVMILTVNSQDSEG
jgi:uncharacterized membrane protein YbaN (DUF454 family)